MRTLVFSPKAEADIDEIYDFTEEHWGFEKAEAYTFELRDVCRLLAEGNRSGRMLPDIKRTIWRCPFDLTSSSTARQTLASSSSAFFTSA